VAALARRQHGVVALVQLLALGLSRRTVTTWVASGRLHPIHRGVYAVGHPLLSLQGRLMAAVLACGPYALISHRTAAMMWGLLDDFRAVIDVVSAANRRGRKGIAFHRVRRLDPEDRHVIDGIPVTSLARTLLDIAEVVPRRRLVYALERAEKQHVLDLREIRACMARSPGRRGLKPLRQALREIEPEAQYAHEGLERLFIAFCRGRGIEMPAMNVVVEGFTVDALWEKRKLIVELDSWQHHRQRRSFEEDRRRDTILALAGYSVLRVTKRLLEGEPDRLEALISASPSRAATA
jgi:very-short-patch-repair endonuclease